MTFAADLEAFLHNHRRHGPQTAAVMKGGSAKAEGPLAGTIIDALNKAKKDKANVVGPLEPHYFNDFSAWCRNVGLIQEGETVEAAVRASG